MKHKLLTALLALVSALCLILGISACGGGNSGGGDANPSDHSHTFAATWSSDESGHWHAATCEHTSERKDEAAHTYEKGKCKICDYEHEAHTFVYSDKTEEGHTGTCSTCGKAVTEEHTYQNGVCKDCEYAHEEHTYQNGVCSTCDYEHEDHNFTYSDKTEEEHTGTCSTCGKTVTEEHTYQNGVCKDCDYTHEEHTYQNGVCSTCDYKHEDHNFTYSDKTETQHKVTCSVCGKVETENHSYQNGVCTECEYAHQSHNYGASDTCSVCGAKKPYSKENSKIYLGEYPQTEVTNKNDPNSSLRNSLNMMAGNKPTSSNAGKWTSYDYYISGNVSDYMWYIDIPYQGSRYRGVYFTNYRPYWTKKSSSTDYSYQDDNGYKTSTVYWFKWEPIEWRILEEKDGTALLMANIILDSQQYYHESSGTRTINGRTVYENNYKESDIRKWLTETFYTTAFDSTAKQIIETTTVDNGLTSTGHSFNPYTCENTKDKVFLLSYKEVLNTSYGFDSVTSSTSTRRLKPTDYAKSQGVYIATSGTAGWWLRSPDSNYSNSAHDVHTDGYVFGTTESVDYTDNGVVPALRIKL